MKRKEKEKDEANPKLKLLDWKLDFHDKDLQREYSKAYNQLFVSYFRFEP